MSKVIIHLEPELAEKLEAAALAQQMTPSSWIAKLIREKLASEWPEDVVAFAGAWKELPEIEVRPLDASLDVPRETFS